MTVISCRIGCQLSRGDTATFQYQLCIAAILIANGGSMEEVKDHLGHSSIRVTSDSSGHLFPSARRSLAEGLEAIFQQAATAPPAEPVEVLCVRKCVWARYFW